MVGIIVLTCVFSCMCLHCCCGICLYCSQIAITFMPVNCLLTSQGTLQKSGAYGIVRGTECRRKSSRSPSSWTQAIRVFPLPSPVLGMRVPLAFPSPRSFSKEPWERSVVLRLSGLGTWLNSVKAAYELLRFWQADVEIYSSWPSKTSLLCSLVHQTYHLPVWSILPLSTLTTLCVWGWVLGTPKELGNQ